jgi:hypothetical protein
MDRLAMALVDQDVPQEPGGPGPELGAQRVIQAPGRRLDRGSRHPVQVAQSIAYQCPQPSRVSVAGPQSVVGASAVGPEIGGLDEGLGQGTARFEEQERVVGAPQPFRLGPFLGQILEGVLRVFSKRGVP